MATGIILTRTVGCYRLAKVERRTEVVVLLQQGQQAFGTQIVGGCRYVFDSNGETSTKPVTLPAGQLAMWNKAQNYYSNTNYIILVNSRTHKVGVFRGSSYNWEPDMVLGLHNGRPWFPRR